MNVTLTYGSVGLAVDLPETPGFLGLLEPSEPAPLPDPDAAVAGSLREPIACPPLADLCRGRQSACLVVSDATRPVPNRLLLPPLLRTLESQGIPRSRILVLVATGMHRPLDAGEVATLLGPEAAQSCSILSHDARNDDELVEVGRIGGGVPALVNRRYAAADLKILTGLIEPHPWAGFSGGRKSILPGLSSLGTLRHMHGPAMVAHPGCRCGRLDGNPFHEAGVEVMALAGADFLVNVTLDTRKRVTGVFSGHPEAAHQEGCRFLAGHCVRQLDAPLDFVVTTGGGAPLDATLYQAVKGISVAAAAVKPGGDILIASRCDQGLGSPDFQEALGRVDSPQAFLDRLLRQDDFAPDQWCVQELCKVLSRQRVWLYSEGLSRDELRRCHLEPVESVEASIRALLERHGQSARWAAVPAGPQVVLELAGPSREPAGWYAAPASATQELVS